MATLTVRNLPEETLAAFRVVAARKGRSMEAQARELIDAAVREEGPRPQVTREEVEARVERAQARVREMFGGEVPKGLVDEFIAERRAAAGRGE